VIVLAQIRLDGYLRPTAWPQDFVSAFGKAFLQLGRHHRLIFDYEYAMHRDIPPRARRTRDLCAAVVLSMVVFSGRPYRRALTFLSEGAAKSCSRWCLIVSSRAFISLNRRE
jgi:hypothetical protein